jgi:hypothetical protein
MSSFITPQVGTSLTAQIADVMRILAERWRELTDEDKKVRWSTRLVDVC